MLTISFNPAELLWCRKLGQLRSGSMNHAETVHSRHMHGASKPPWFRHYLGAIGELAYSRYSGLPVDRHTLGRGDSGEDFSDGTQVKASDRPRANLLIPEGDWNRKPARRYALVEVRLEASEAELIGWITRDEASRVKVLQSLPYGSAWLIERRHLHPFVEDRNAPPKRTPNRHSQTINTSPTLQRHPHPGEAFQPSTTDTIPRP